MSVAVATLDRIHNLEQFYRLGYRTRLIDQTLDKLLAAEKQQAGRDLKDLEARLSRYEQQYHTPSSEFYRRFRAGELGDEMDFVEWSVFFDMYQTAKRGLRLLEAGKS